MSSSGLCVFSLSLVFVVLNTIMVAATDSGSRLAPVKHTGNPEYFHEAAEIVKESGTMDSAAQKIIVAAQHSGELLNKVQEHLGEYHNDIADMSDLVLGPVENVSKTMRKEFGSLAEAEQSRLDAFDFTKPMGQVASVDATKPDDSHEKQRDIHTGDQSVDVTPGGKFRATAVTPAKVLALQSKIDDLKTEAPLSAKEVPQQMIPAEASAEAKLLGAKSTPPLISTKLEENVRVEPATTAAKTAASTMTAEDAAHDAAAVEAAPTSVIAAQTVPRRAVTASDYAVAAALSAAAVKQDRLALLGSQQGVGTVDIA